MVRALYFVCRVRTPRSRSALIVARARAQIDWRVRARLEAFLTYGPLMVAKKTAKQRIMMITATERTNVVILDQLQAAHY